MAITSTKVVAILSQADGLAVAEVRGNAHDGNAVGLGQWDAHSVTPFQGR